MFRVSSAAAQETRAKNNYYTSINNYDINTGLVCISPVLDLFRDPRWGRNQVSAGVFVCVCGCGGEVVWVCVCVCVCVCVKGGECVCVCVRM